MPGHEISYISSPDEPYIFEDVAHPPKLIVVTPMQSIVQFFFIYYPY